MSDDTRRLGPRVRQSIAARRSIRFVPDGARPDKPKFGRTVSIAAGAVAILAVVIVAIILADRDRSAPFEPPPSFKAAVARGAILGAHQSSFDSSLGRGQLQSQMMGDLRTFGYARCPSDGGDQFSVTFAANIAIAIAWTPCGSEPTSTEALALARQMLPSDSRIGSGSNDLFMSHTLARSVERSWFEDCAGNDVAVGTASIASTEKNGFDVTVGTCTNTG
jgi:hypothetical protein